jgi:hypothetical protein
MSTNLRTPPQQGVASHAYQKPTDAMLTLLLIVMIPPIRVMRTANVFQTALAKILQILQADNLASF